MKTGNVRLLSAFLLFLFLLLCAASLLTGSGSAADAHQLLSLLLGKDADPTALLIFREIRLPRLCAGILTGASLALAGAGMQSIFRNPLADPSITGVSAGAALGAVLAIALSFPPMLLEISAFSAGLIAAGTVFFAGKIDGKISAFSTLLAGIAVNALCGAIVGFFMYSVRDAGLRGFVFWTLGSLDRCDMTSVATASALALPSWILMFALARPLNVMLLGRQQAFHSGVDVKKIWVLTLAAAAAMTASSVAICGIIGFVGLVVPHIIRLACGPDNRALMPLSALAGACLVMASDILSRCVSPTDPIPIGAITSLLGAPFFIMILRGKRRGDFDD